MISRSREHGRSPAWLLAGRPRRLLAGLAALIGLLSISCGPPAAQTPPNIVMIISDDQGYPDFGFMGSDQVLTPVIDRLAAEGTVFPNGYVTSSICAPSLQSLLTGLHPYEFNLRRLQLGRRGLSIDMKTVLEHFSTLPRLLGAHGYASFQGGKIVDKSYEIAGFSEGLNESGQGGRDWGAGGTIGRATMAPVFDFIDRNQDRPFFLWFAPMLPHYPHDAPERFREPFEGKGLVPGAVAYYANILRFDEVVGELLQHLEARGLRENTLIVFLADNGWDQPPGEVPAGATLALGGPKGKKSMYELGFRTPMIFSWPGHLPEGEVKGDLVSSVDLYPTLLDFAGAAPMLDREGSSLRPLLEGREPWPRKMLRGSMAYVREHPLRSDELGEVNLRHPELAWFARTKRWHYIWYEDWDADELFDLAADPLETLDLSGERPRIVTQMRERIRSWRRKLKRRALLEPPP